MDPTVTTAVPTMDMDRASTAPAGEAVGAEAGVQDSMVAAGGQVTTAVSEDIAVGVAEAFMGGAVGVEAVAIMEGAAGPVEVVVFIAAAAVGVEAVAGVAAADAGDPLTS